MTDSVDELMKSFLYITHHSSKIKQLLMSSGDTKGDSGGWGGGHLKKIILSHINMSDTEKRALCGQN